MNSNNVEPAIDPEAIAAALEETRNAFHMLLASLDQESWNYKSRVPQWTNAEILFHVAFVLNTIPREAGLIRRGIPFPTPPAALFDWLQERLVRRAAAGHTLNSIADYYDRAHARILKELARVEAHQWHRSARYPCVDPPYLCGRVTVERLFLYGVHHFKQHEMHVVTRKPRVISPSDAEIREGVRLTTITDEKGLFVYPAGEWRKWMFRAPIALWRLGLGRLMGDVLMLLTHTGRKSGLPRRALVEYYRMDDRPYVVCAWGRRSQWGRNILQDPRVTIQTSSGSTSARAARVSEDDELRRAYSLFMKRDPILTRKYLDMLGLDHDPEALVKDKERLYIFRFDPTDEVTPPPLPADLAWVWFVLPLGLLLLRLWRRTR